MNAVQYAWCYLIKHGSVIGQGTHDNTVWSYYGGGFNNKPKLTVECLTAILECGVAWDKIKGPSDGFESSFEGTFCEPAMISTLRGELILNNGKKYEWGCKFEQAVNVFEMLEYLMQHPNIESVVVPKLVELEKYK